MASLNSFSVGLSLVFDLIHAVTYSEIECKKHCSDGSFFKHPPPPPKKKEKTPLLYSAKHKYFGGKLESARLSVFVSVCVVDTTFCQRAGGDIKSHSVTALVFC